ncbi:MAG: alpha/beta hydrolase [Sandaracinaceae bacterium]|nr:alpha/beta hydrolase [Sandaracinaceae bacterium]
MVVTLELRGADGLTLVADAFGEPTHPTVVLLHGGGQTRHAWGGTAAALAADGFYALTVDQRGHGDSAWDPAGRYGFEAYADDARALAAQLDRPVIVGASLGGIAGLLAAGEAPRAELGGLVLVDIAHRARPEGVARVIEFMRERALDGFGSLEEAADFVAAYLPHRERPSDVSGLEKNLRRGEDGRWRWHWDPAFLQRGPDGPIVAERLAAAARSLSLRTLLVRGRASDVLSEEGAREFLALVPHAEYVDVADAAHMVAGDRNDAFTAAVSRFLRAQEGAEQAPS